MCVLTLCSWKWASKYRISFTIEEPKKKKQKGNTFWNAQNTLIYHNYIANTYLKADQPYMNKLTREQ